MKTQKLFLFSLLIIAGMICSCGLIACAQQVSGNGNVVTKDISVSPFTQLELKGVFNVFISQGEKENVKVEADENLQDVVEILQNDKNLTIKCKEKFSIRKSTKMNIYITVKNLDHLHINGVGSVSSTTPLNQDNLALDISGVGNTELQLNCKKLNVNISAVGNIKLKGNADAADISASGTGNLKAFDLMVKKLNISVSGVGNAEVHADEEINISSSGIGNLTYSGNATVKSKVASGIGNVKKL